MPITYSMRMLSPIVQLLRPQRAPFEPLDMQTQHFWCMRKSDAPVCISLALAAIAGIAVSTTQPLCSEVLLQARCERHRLEA
eukprot:1440-Heterococcus_DN1.PRE.1